MRHTSWVVWKLSPYLQEDKMLNMKYNYIVMKMGPKAPIAPEGPWGPKTQQCPIALGAKGLGRARRTLGTEGKRQKRKIFMQSRDDKRDFN